MLHWLLVEYRTYANLQESPKTGKRRMPERAQVIRPSRFKSKHSTLDVTRPLLMMLHGYLFHSLRLCQTQGEVFHLFNEPLPFGQSLERLDERPLSRQHFERILGDLFQPQKHLRAAELCDSNPHFTKVSINEDDVGKLFDPDNSIHH
jgi:hypothetical protein